jgi:hypothetical protein
MIKHIFLEKREDFRQRRDRFSERTAGSIVRFSE